MRCHLTGTSPTCVLLCDGLLHPVLPHVLHPGGVSRAHRLGAVAFGDGNDPDRVLPSRDRLMPGHRLAHPGELAGQVREFHSLVI